MQLVKDGDQWRVISMVGMGRIGKKTPAKEIYNHVDVVARFDCRAWVIYPKNLQPEISCNAHQATHENNKRFKKSLDDL